MKHTFLLHLQVPVVEADSLGSHVLFGLWNTQLTQKTLVTGKVRRVFRRFVNMGQYRELAPETQHKTHAHVLMKHVNAVLVPLHLWYNWRRQSTLLPACNGIFMASSYSQSLTVELDNKSPPNLSLHSCASLIHREGLQARASDQL